MSENKPKKSRAGYLREWRKRNPEKAKQYVRSYWARKLSLQEEAPQTKANTVE